MSHIICLLMSRSRERFRDETYHSGRVDKEVCESVESFISAIQSDAQFVGVTYSFVEQSSLK